MKKKLKIDPKKVEYDGHSFRLIIQDEDALLKKLKEKQAEILKDLEKEEAKNEIKAEGVMKPLSELLAEVEPRLTAQQNIMVDRASYDNLKAIAVELAKALEFECGNRCAHQNPCNAKDALATARKLMGEE